MVSTMALTALLLTLVNGTVYAGSDSDCENYYGGTCITNKRFEIEKEVRLEGDSSWKGKVYIDLGDENETEKEIEFRISCELQ